MAQPVTKHHRPKTQFFSTLLEPHPAAATP